MMGQNMEGVSQIGSRFIEAVMAALQDDIVSFAEFRQISRDASDGISDATNLRCALKVLLDAGVQVGQAINDGREYVKFIAWRGSADERIQRAERLIEETPEQDRDFAVWLCLEAKVDEYEQRGK